MSSNSKYSFEEFIKESVDNFELPYDPKDWDRLERDLPRGKASFPWTKVAVISGVVVISAFIAYLLFFNNDNASVESAFMGDAVKNETHDEKVNNVKEIDILSDEKITVLPVDEETMKTEGEEIEVQEIKIDSKENTVVKSEGSEIVTKISRDDNIDTDLSPGQIAITTPPSSKFFYEGNQGCMPLAVGFVPEQIADSIEYLWDFGDGQLSEEKLPTHTFETPGEYSVTLTTAYKNSKLSSSTIASEKIVVKIKPAIDFDVIEEGMGYIFVNRTRNAYYWKWFVDGKEISGDELPSYDFLISGPKTIKLSASHLNGCVATQEKTIEIKIHHNYYMPNCFTPNGNGISDYFGPEGTNMGDYKFSMQIFNRQGICVFETTDPYKKWDGKIRQTNEKAKQGVYSYQVVTVDQYGNTDRRVGPVTLLDLENE